MTKLAYVGLLELYIWGSIKSAHLWEEALFFLCCKEEANHTEELQVGCSHLQLSQGAVEEVYGQIEGLFLEMYQLLVTNLIFDFNRDVWVTK